MTVSGELKHGWVVGSEEGKAVVLKNKRGKLFDALSLLKSGNL